VIAQFIKSAIRSKRLDSAKEGLQKLATRFAGIRSDIQHGLWARYYLVDGKYDDATASWSKIKNKSTSIHTRIREDIIESTLKGKALTVEQRADLEKELADLHKGPKERHLDALEIDL
jgi:hypothetical protein